MKWQTSHAEKDQAKFLTHHIQAQVTVHKAHEEYTESMENHNINQAGITILLKGPNRNKKGDRNNAANYRPVSLTSICCNVYEHIMQHLEDNGSLTDSQHSLRTQYTFKTHLLTLIDELLQ